MRWIPTKITSWPAGMALLAAGLSFAGVSNAGEPGGGFVAGVAHWPWIAVAVIVGLLGVISFASRRRIHAVCGS
ncbi:MAG: hypothetical protein WDO72_17615 [Pseudomonadota bacterium]